MLHALFLTTPTPTWVLVSSSKIQLAGDCILCNAAL